MNGGRGQAGCGGGDEVADVGGLSTSCFVFFGVAVFRSARMAHSCVRAGVPGRRAAAQAPNGPHDPSPRRNAVAAAERAPNHAPSRALRARNGSPQFPLNDRIPSPRAWLDAVALAPQHSSGRREERQAHDATHGSRARRLRSPAFIGAAQGCPRRRRTVACAAAWTPSPRDEEMRTWKSSTTRRRAFDRETTRPLA